MSALFLKRCFRHPAREAAVRCPGCGRTFCRECVTEHEERVLCADCLARSSRPAAPRTALLLLRAGSGLVGLLAAWLFFFLLGQALLLVPSTFHGGTPRAAAAGR